MEGVTWESDELKGLSVDTPECYTGKMPDKMQLRYSTRGLKVRLMKKAEFINRVKADRKVWNELMSQVGTDLMLEPGQEGDWSAKDILAHVMWYEREMVRTIKSRALAGSDLWELPLDERNAAIHDEIKDMTLAEIRSKGDLVFTALMEQLELLPEEGYGDSKHFENMPAEWAPWDMIADNTFRHYAEHTESIRRLAERDSPLP